MSSKRGEIDEEELKDEKKEKPESPCFKNSEEMRLKSTASRSSDKAEYMSNNLSHYVDSKRRQKRSKLGPKKKQKPIPDFGAHPTDFECNTKTHSISFH